MNKIRKGDEVLVLNGKFKGKKGVVLSRVNDEYLLVEGVNIVKKHQKPNPMKGDVGGVVDKTMPIHQSNVSLFDKETGKPSRVAVKKVDGKSVRVLVKTGAQLAN
ncbi:LSU ribosomal protein L24P [Limnobacter thiooxidans]|jgi:large subunit ribosomal protein L24|uniref:Large ribosomal subunit protein uL24 n=1 Tax=Limnobacter thiooxidans TaxID=131080 RepID=A0AA86J0K9_9BURK|nr:50S ribosomal protein L24 [Limnobacter sp.]MCZ8015097.1 50S ribosomal protein L24 [Limnobacter sp.]RZS40247.1 LSU ribosomal protein L24P [Limnobacter thiooxidans]BET27319.1 50S ribosomal protein L24 [Limnobacter thiooxidans]